jgi:hypothetical protein
VNSPIFSVQGPCHGKREARHSGLVLLLKYKPRCRTHPAPLVGVGASAHAPPPLHTSPTQLLSAALNDVWELARGCKKYNAIRHAPLLRAPSSPLGGGVSDLGLGLGFPPSCRPADFHPGSPRAAPPGDSHQGRLGRLRACLGATTAAPRALEEYPLRVPLWTRDQGCASATPQRPVQLACPVLLSVC